MENNLPLTKEEFLQMLSLIKRHSEVSMDQWEAWKLDTNKDKLFIDLRLSVGNHESCYEDLDDLIAKSSSKGR